MCKKTLDYLKEELNSHPVDEFDYPSNIVIASLECDNYMGVLDDLTLV